MGGAAGAVAGYGVCMWAFGINANAINQTYTITVQAAVQTENVVAWGTGGHGGVQHQVQEAIAVYDAAVDAADLVFVNCLLEELRNILEALGIL